MSTVVQMVQGSAAWHAYRQTMRNASESAAVLGVSPWMTPYQLWLVKTGRSGVQANAAMSRGLELEPRARAAYEAAIGTVMQPLVMQDGQYSASLDGITLDGSLIVEIKCPMRGQESELWRAVAVGDVPRHYGIQIQHQLMVSGATQATLWVFDGSEGEVVHIERDESTMAAIRESWDAFQSFLDGDVPPPLAEADVRQRDDSGWAAAAATYLEAKRSAEATEKALEAAKATLAAMASHPKESGSGVTVTRFWKKGNVDYKSIPVLHGFDVEPYRGKGREELRFAVRNG